MGFGGRAGATHDVLAFLDRAEDWDNLVSGLRFRFPIGFLFGPQSTTQVRSFRALTFAAGNQGGCRVALTSGGQPTELLARDGQKSGELERDLAARR